MNSKKKVCQVPSYTMFKGTVSRDFQHFFYQKTQPRPHMNSQKRFCKIVGFREDIRKKTCVCEVNDYVESH